MRTVLFHLLMAMALLIGCSKESRDAPQAKPQERTESLSTFHPESLSTIAVRTILEGTTPPMPELSMAADRKCATMHEHTVRSEQVIVGVGGLLQNAFVYIKDGLQGHTFPPPRDTAVLDQQGCLYRPRVLGMRVNQPLVIINSDPTLHNIHALPQVNRGFNIAQPRRGMRTERTFTQPEVMIRVKCDVHPWMASFIGVLEHPYFGVSGPDGVVVLNAVPAGEYTVAVWHERYGEQERRLTVRAGEQKDVEFRYKESL